MRILIKLLAIVPGAILLLLSVLLLNALADMVATDASLQLTFLLAALFLGIGWYLYMRLPKFIKDLFKSPWQRPKKDTRP